MKYVHSLEMRKVFDDGYFSIYISDEENTLVYKISGYPKFSEVIRNGHDVIFRILTEGNSQVKIRNVVADLLDAKILLDQDIKFIGRTSYRRMAKAGVHNLAILLSGEIHVKINVEKTLQYLGPGIFQNVNLFESLEEAERWFKRIQ